MAKVSIILLHYQNVAATLHCLSSLRPLSKDCEIILVDNDPQRTLPEVAGVRYISVRKNLGFGAGINLGAKAAQGEYLFVLNNDCFLFPDTLKVLSRFLDAHADVAIAAPMLLDKSQERYPLVGTQALTPWTGLFALTFINKYFPNNPVSRRYWVNTKNISSPTPIDVAAGTAFLIRKSIFQQIGGFDEDFFLYFEESDLCARIKKLGWGIYLLPNAKVIHYWAQSTPSSPKTKAIFGRSRFLYFRKHFGWFPAVFIQWVTLPSYQIALSLILLLGAFLRFFHLSSTMMFIGDQAWFYNSARDALLAGKLPLLGITSSVTWLHQGPIYTYILIPGLLISHFSPVSGAVFTSFIGTISILLVYFLAKSWGSRRFALLASFVFAVSPLNVIHARFPYHTSVIPFFFILFLLFLNRRQYFWSFLFLGFLYQSELATVILWPIALFFLIRQKYHVRLLDLFGFALGILPFIVAGPIQTFGVFVWSLYHLIFHQVSSDPASNFYLELLSRFIFPLSQPIALFLFAIALFASLRYFRSFLLWLLFPLLAMFINRTPSEAYFVILLAPLALALGYGLSRLPKFIPLVLLANIYFLISTNFLSRPGDYYAPAFSDRVNIARQILSQSSTALPIVKTVGPGGQFATTQLPYPYLAWWLSQYQAPSGTHDSFEVLEPANKVQVLK